MIAFDKQAHLLAGISVAAVVMPMGITPMLIATLVVGGLKEVRDYYYDGTPDVYDFVYTAVGGILFTGWAILTGMV